MAAPKLDHLLTLASNASVPTKMSHPSSYPAKPIAAAMRGKLAPPGYDPNKKISLGEDESDDEDAGEEDDDEEDDNEDADANGNLNGMVDYDNKEEEEEDSTPVPTKTSNTKKSVAHKVFSEKDKLKMKSGMIQPAATTTTTTTDSKKRDEKPKASRKRKPSGPVPLEEGGEEDNDDDNTKDAEEEEEEEEDASKKKQRKKSSPPKKEKAPKPKKQKKIEAEEEDGDEEEEEEKPKKSASKKKATKKKAEEESEDEEEEKKQSASKKRKSPKKDEKTSKKKKRSRKSKEEEEEAEESTSSSSEDEEKDKKKVSKDKDETCTDLISPADIESILKNRPEKQFSSHTDMFKKALDGKWSEYFYVAKYLVTDKVTCFRGKPYEECKAKYDAMVAKLTDEEKEEIKNLFTKTGVDFPKIDEKQKKEQAVYDEDHKEALEKYNAQQKAKTNFKKEVEQATGTKVNNRKSVVFNTNLNLTTRIDELCAKHTQDIRRAIFEEFKDLYDRTGSSSATS